MTTLGRQLLVPTASLSVFTALALALIAWSSASEGRDLRRTADDVRAASALAFALADASREEERLVSALRGLSPGERARPLAEASARVAEIVARIAARPLAPPAGAIWEQYLRARASQQGALDEIVRTSGVSDPATLAVAYDKWELLGDRAAALLKDFTTLHLRLLDATIAELQSRRERGLLAAAAATLLGVVLAAAFSGALARSVVQPIVLMARAAEGMPGGTAFRVPGAERSDEIGVLARSLNGMTERLVAANARLADAVRARDEFLSIASHELKTPLTPLQLRLDQLLRTAARDADGQLSRDAIVRTSESLRRQVVRLGKLVTSLLDVSRISSGRLILELQDVSAADLAHEAVQHASEELAAAGCDVRIECPEDVRFPGDRLRLDQVLSNLVANAAKHAPGTPVTLRIRGAADCVELEVEDRGPGIAPSDHDRIFDRFERAVPEGEGATGLGLGLYIARQIARAHGGELSVESDLGGGARFTLRLPSGAARGSARLPSPPAAG